MSYQQLYVEDAVNRRAFHHEVNQRLREGWRIQSTAFWYDAEFNQPHYVAYLVKEIEVGGEKKDEPVKEEEP